MALLHKIGQSDSESVYDAYAQKPSEGTIAKYKMPDDSHDPEVITDLILDELLLDGNAKQNLSTFCQTYADPYIRKIMDACIDKNMIDKDEYPQTAEIERRCVQILADLWNSPESKTTIGCSTIGSSEAAMLGGLAMKWRWREKRQKEGKPTDKPNLITGPVQVCWEKFARYFDVELREIPMEHDRLLMTPEEVIKRIDEKYHRCRADFRRDLHPTVRAGQGDKRRAGRLPEADGARYPHPCGRCQRRFHRPLHPAGYRMGFPPAARKIHQRFGPQVRSLAAGCGLGGMARRKRPTERLDFQRQLSRRRDASFALNFSRPGGQIIAQYYNFLRNGRKGYERIHKACQEHGMFIAREIEKMGIFDILYDGSTGIPGAAWMLKKGTDLGFNIFDLSDRMRVRGWQIASYTLPVNCQDMAIQRVLIRHGFSHDMAQLLIDDLQRSIEYLRKNPMTHSLDEKTAGGYHH
ncbi:MAG: pyridoxal-dependent decarboxylase [Alistipes inops]